MSLSEFIKKIFAGPKDKACQAGQAVVEYILVLVIVVSIILGILFQFNDAFKNFLQSYFGDYLACLLETGELPTLGDGSGGGECQANFAGFSVASGKPLKPPTPGGGGGGSGSGSGGSGGSGSGSGSDSDSSSSKNSKAAAKAPTPAKSSGSGSGGRGANAMSARANSERMSRGTRNRPAAQPVENAGDSASDSSGSGDSSDGFSIGGRRRRAAARSTVSVSDEYVADKEKDKEGKEGIKGKASAKQKQASRLRASTFMMSTPKIPESLAGVEEETSFSFAVLIKFLLIGGILIVLFIFLGGQALQIKKSWQKSE